MWWREALDLGYVRRELAKRQPALHFVDDDQKLRGSIVIEHGGLELDRFAVEIDLGPVRDGELPTVREIGGRIPWIADRHINADGSACVCLPEDYYFSNPGPFDLVSYLDGAVRSFFLGQALVERGDPWPYGEWNHGGDGHLEWREKFFQGISAERRQAFVQLLLTKELKGHTPCPCASGKRLRACHYHLLQRLRRLYPRPRGNAPGRGTDTIKPKGSCPRSAEARITPAATRT